MEKTSYTRIHTWIAKLSFNCDNIPTVDEWSPCSNATLRAGRVTLLTLMYTQKKNSHSLMTNRTRSETTACTLV